MSLTDVARFFQEGGLFMIPIAALLAVGLAIAVERAWFLARVRRADARLWRELRPLLAQGRLDQAGRLLEQDDSLAARVLRGAWLRLPAARGLGELETVVEEGLLEAVTRLERRTHYLATLANIATLLGLLGTIIGLIQAFTAVAGADPAQKADLLSQSISVAMNTTAFGLMVAIPLLLVHAWLQARGNEQVDRLELGAVRFLNTVAAVRGLGR